MAEWNVDHNLPGPAATCTGGGQGSVILQHTTLDVITAQDPGIYFVYPGEEWLTGRQMMRNIRGTVQIFNSLGVGLFRNSTHH